MSRPLAVGDTVHGHMAGYLGRDYYDCARIEVLGADWVVLRTEIGMAVAQGLSSNPGALMQALIAARDEFEEWFCNHDRPEANDA